MMLVYVTVGTTSFDELIQTVSSDKAIEALADQGYNSMLVQYGRGNEVFYNEKVQSVKIDAYRYKPSIHDDILSADLVISHAGAGSCLEVLGAGKKLLVVVNEKLMDNHQLELAKQLKDDGHLIYCTCSTLVDTLKSMDLSALKPLLEPKTSKWADDITLHFGF